MATESTSCTGCKFLYSQDTGYSNYTVTDTTLDCAKDKNPNLPADLACDWNENPEQDNWDKTNASRCELYSKGVRIDLDVDGEVHPADCTEDVEAIEVVCKHANIEPRNPSTP